MLLPRFPTDGPAPPDPPPHPRQPAKLPGAKAPRGSSSKGKGFHDPNEKAIGEVHFGQRFSPFQQNSRKRKRKLRETWAGNLGQSKTWSFLHGKKSETEFKAKKMGKKHFFSTTPKHLQGVWGEKKAENFLCIIKSRAFPNRLQHPALPNGRESTKADQVESNESARISRETRRPHR